MEVEKALWKVYATVYDGILLRFLPYLTLLGRVKEALGVKDRRRVLDAGCGTGNLIQSMIKSSVSISIVGIDFDRAMLERARAKIGVNGRVTLRKGSLDHPLPFANEEFDGIACVNVLYALADPSHFMKECRRVLKAKGKMVLVTPPEQPKMGPVFWEHLQALGQKQKYPLFRFFTLCCLMLQLSPSLVPFLFINRIIQGQSSFTFFGEKELISLVTRCGFLIQKLEKAYGGQAWFLVCIKPANAEDGIAGKGA